MSAWPSFVWLIALPWAAAPLVYLLGRSGRAGRRAARWLPAAVLAGAWWPLWRAAVQFQTDGALRLLWGAVPLRLDGVALLLAVATLALTMPVALYSAVTLPTADDGAEKYGATLLLLTGALIGLGCAADLFNLWLWFEAMATTTYFLVAFERRQALALEAGFKYLVQSAAGSALIVIGIALILATAGTLDLAELPQAAAASAGWGLRVAGALCLVGFGVKAALVPLHTWLPDAHTQAPAGISALLSGLVIEAGLIALLRSLSVLALPSAQWGHLLLIAGALNMAVGNLLALRQTQVKRLLAYSSVTHIGYMLVGVGVTLTTGAPLGAQGGLFHLIAHGLLKGLAFLAAGALLYALYAARGDHRPLAIADLSGAAQRYPIAALALSLAVLGLGGLPPLVGFLSKWQIVTAAVAAGGLLLPAAAVFAALNSVFSLAYYAPLVNRLYRRTPSSAVAQGAPLAPAVQGVLLALAAAVLLLGLWTNALTWLTQPAGAVLGR